MAEPRWKIGDSVWVPRAHAFNEEIVSCPVCFGKRRVVVILGNDEHVSVPCEMCGVGYEGPRGTVRVRRAGGEVEPHTISSISYRNEAFVYCGYHGMSFAENEAFDTHEEAEAALVPMLEQAKADAERMFASNIDNAAKKHSWSVGYGRSCIARLKRELAYHENRIIESKEPRDAR